MMKTMTNATQQQTPIDTLIADAEGTLKQDVWPQLEAIRQTVFERVLAGFIQNKVGEEHFYSVTGYAHDDLGRDVADKIFAHALQAEAALVRVNFASGTHALSVALNACLSHGDTMLVVTGHPYDTLEEVIGLRGDSKQSLIAKGVNYVETTVFNEDDSLNTSFNDAQKEQIKSAKMVYFQRSRGYSVRPTMTIADLKPLIAEAKAINPNAVVMVDNCYGEFIEADEPTAIGADIIAGSLVKNPGGGIMPSGGYIAGRKDLIEEAANVLTCPGVGNEGGYTFDLNRLLFQGLFLAPGMVHEALKGMTLCAKVFDGLGYQTQPVWDAPRADIIQLIHLGSADKLTQFCQVLQSVSPIDSAVKPVPANIPGYLDQVVMAGGTFIQGSTIELSADGPLREPYPVFLQGGLNYAHTKYALKKVLETLQN